MRHVATAFAVLAVGLVGWADETQSPSVSSGNALYPQPIPQTSEDQPRAANELRGGIINDDVSSDDPLPELHSHSNAIRLTGQASESSEITAAFEERLRMLEEQLEFQKQENKLFREQLAEFGKDKSDKPKEDAKKDGKKDDKSFKGGWKHQLTFESPDKNFRRSPGRKNSDRYGLAPSQSDGVWCRE